MAPKPPTGPRWRPNASAPTDGRAGAPAPSKKGKIFGLLALILALGGLLAALTLFWRPMPEPFFLTLPIREYEARQWPVNYFAVQDSQLLLPHFKRNRDGYFFQSSAAVQKELQALRLLNEPAVVVHLTCLARTYKNEVYLLPGDASPDTPASWLPLSSVLSALRQCQTRHRLLILDIMRPIADARLGILGDDVALTLEEQLKKDTDGNLFVLAACGRGQVALVSEDMRRSVFAHYLDLGLRGFADGAGPYGHTNRRVTVQELAAYVASRVNRWANANRGLEQTPVLWGQGEDFPLTTYQDAPAADDFAHTVPAYPKWLAEGWDLREQWAKEEQGPKISVYRLAPRAVRQLDGNLLRAEQRWRGGVEDKRVLEELADALTKIKERVKSATTLPAPPSPHSLIQVRPASDAATAPATKDLALLLTQVEKAKPEDLKKTREEFLKKHEKVDSIALTDSVCYLAIATSALTVKKLEFLASLLPELSDYAETVALKRLLAFSDKVKEKDWKWPVAEVHQYLRTRKAMEKMQVASWSDPQTLPWVAGAVQEADDKRRDGEKKLLGDRPPLWPDALKRLADAERLYDEVTKNIEKALEARANFDRALLDLPGLALWLAAHPSPDDNVDRAWNHAVRATLICSAYLESPKAEDLAALDDASRDLRRSLGTLRLASASLAEQAADDGLLWLLAEYTKWEHLFTMPGANGKQREALWQTGRLLGGKILQKAIAEAGEAKPNQDGGQPANPVDPGRLSARAGLSTDLLALAGLARIDLLKEKKDDTRTAAARQALGEQLREAWVVSLANQLKAPDTPPHRADRLARIRPPLEPDIEGEPAAEIHRRKLQEFRSWLASRYQREAEAFPAGSAGAIFYADAADGLRK